MARALDLPIILVVGMQLGCLNDALLTAQAVWATGLQLAGWVANRIDPQMIAFDENVLALIHRLDCPLLGVLPFEQNADAKKITIFRRENGETKIIEADLEKIKAKQAEDIILKPLDIVEVTQTGSERRKYPPIIGEISLTAENSSKLPLRVID